MKKMMRGWFYRTAAKAAALRSPPARRSFGLGILKLDRLGDAVLALGAIRRLLAAHPQSDTLIVASPIAAPLFRAEFPAAAVVELPPFAHSFAPDYLHFLLTSAPILRSIRVDRLVVLRHQPSDYLHTIARLLRPRVTFATRVSHPWENISLSYPRADLAAYPAEPQATCLELEAHRRVVELTTGSAVPLVEILPSLHSVTSRDGEGLLLCPEAGDPARAYPPSALATAVLGFLARRVMPVELCLPPDADAQPWQSALATAGISIGSVHQPKDVAGLAGLIGAAGLVLANESAPAHLATALDKRGTFILGGGHFGLLAPWQKSARQRWIYNRLDCYDCRWSCIHPQRLCLTDIPPERVAEALAQAAAS